MTVFDLRDQEDTALNQRAFRALLAGTAHLVVLIEADGTIAYVSPSVQPLLGYEPGALTGRNVAEFVHPDDLPTAAAILAADAASPGQAGFSVDADIGGDYRLRARSGAWVPFELLRNNLLSEPGVEAILVMGRPVGARYSLDAALGALAAGADNTDALRFLVVYLDERLGGTASMVLVAGDHPGWIYAPENELLIAPFGPWQAAMEKGEPLYLRIDEDVESFAPALQAAAVERGFQSCWCLPLPVRQPQVYAHVRTSVERPTGCLVIWSRLQGPPPAGYLGVLERAGSLAHIALRRRAEAHRMRRLIDYDQLTGALTRTGMRGALAGREGVARLHLMLDLDDFKEINDRHGHPVGDEVLRAVGQRISSVLRQDDLLVRLGGDEFLILVGGQRAEDGVAVAQRVLGALEQPVVLGSLRLPIRASVGIAPWDREVTADQLIERADRAMYAAKEAGKGRWAVWQAT